MKTPVLTLALFLIFLFPTAFAGAPMCSEIFSPVALKKYFSEKGLQIFRSPSTKKEMAFDYKPGKKKPVWLIIHGLGDDMSKVEQLTAQADAEGFGVLRVDLFGHGETLKRYMDTHDQALPGNLYYKDNIVVIKELLQKNGIKDVVIVGHSYGGGISYGLAAEISHLKGKNKIKVHSVHMLAPYVQRIDKFMKNYFQSPDFLWHHTAKTMEQFGANPEMVKTIMDPLFSLTWTMTAGVRYLNDFMTKSLRVDEWQDFAMDPLVEKYTAQSYRKYFIAVTRKNESDLTEQELKAIDLQVEAAIRVTKGIRDFDLLDTSTPLENFGAPIQVIGGNKDKLVIPGQLYEFDQRLNIDNIPHRLEFMDGENSHHLFPRYMAEQVYAAIRAFQKNPQP